MVFVCKSILSATANHAPLTERDFPIFCNLSPSDFPMKAAAEYGKRFVVLDRPNPIGLSALRLIRVEGRVLHVRGIDLLDGTPVLDIKPYVPYSDAFASARAGWLEGLKQDEGDRYE